MATLDFTTARPQDAAGIRKRRVVRIVGPASYAAGGDSFAPSDVQLGTIECIGGGDSFIASSGSATRLVVYDRAAGKLIWFVPNSGAEVAGGQDLSTYSARVEVIGF